MVPELDQLKKLKTLRLNNNELNSLHPQLGDSTKLEELYLSDNLLEGDIPEFRKLDNLKLLWLDKNMLTGSIPEFSSLRKLESLRLEDNFLDGPIPDFCCLSRMITLLLYNNNFTGPLPKFESLPNLRTLFVNDNMLSGEIHDFEVHDNFVHLNAENNNFTGPIPALEHLENFKFLELENNNLSGCVPEYVCDLEEFTIVGNELLAFSGNADYCDPNLNQVNVYCGGSQMWDYGITDENCECQPRGCPSPHPDLAELIKFYHATDGENWLDNNGWRQAAIGATCNPCENHFRYGKWAGIRCQDGITRLLSIDMDGVADGAPLNFQGNNLGGQLPELDFKDLTELILSGNNISGPIPSFSKLPKVELINLSFNSFSGPIPDLSPNENLRQIRLSFNNITGSLPNFDNLPFLEFFTASDNQLEGCYQTKACSLNLFNVMNNTAMPWQGDHSRFCDGQSEIGAPCIIPNSESIGRIQDDCSCKSTTTSINSNDLNLIIHPNPVSNLLRVSSTYNSSAYSILDLNGIILQKGHIINGQINASLLPPSCYIIKVDFNSESPSIARFIKI